MSLSLSCSLSGGADRNVNKPFKIKLSGIMKRSGVMAAETPAPLSPFSVSGAMLWGLCMECYLVLTRGPVDRHECRIHLNSFPVAAVTNDNKFIGLKKHWLVLLWF